MQKFTMRDFLVTMHYSHIPALHCVQCVECTATKTTEHCMIKHLTLIITINNVVIVCLFICLFVVVDCVLMIIGPPEK